MRPIWNGWVTYEEENDPSLQYASIYGIPSHRRTLTVEIDLVSPRRTAADARFVSQTERFFDALPTLYFAILKTQYRTQLFIFAGEPGWKPSNPVPLYLFPWPNRVGRGAICLGRKLEVMTNSDIINHFFTSSFTESSLLANVQFRVEKKIQTVRTFQGWQTLSQKYPDLGSHIVLEDWTLGTTWERCHLNLRRTPKFTYGQTVRRKNSRKNSRNTGRIRMIEGERPRYRYEIEMAGTYVSLFESEIVEVPK